MMGRLEVLAVRTACLARRPGNSGCAAVNSSAARRRQRRAGASRRCGRCGCGGERARWSVYVAPLLAPLSSASPLPFAPRPCLSTPPTTGSSVKATRLRRRACKVWRVYAAPSPLGLAQLSLPSSLCPMTAPSPPCPAHQHLCRYRIWNSACLL